jgi:hypothetical protein
MATETITGTISTTATMAASKELPGYKATMHFFEPIEEHKNEKPFYSTIPFSAPGAVQTNYGSVEKEVVFHDIRGHESEFTLEKHGFEYAKLPTTFTEWRDGAKVKAEHFGEIEEFLKKKLNAKKVILFDHSVSSQSV